MGKLKETLIDNYQQEIEETEAERQMIWAVMEFADAVRDFGFLEMMYQLTKELRKRGYTPSE